jgi:radical SAM-linked protein
MISHRDLLHLFERLFRRAELKLRMSEGFHPKPKVSFPSALALGIEGLDEVVELELVAALDLEELGDRVQMHAPCGLTVRGVTECGQQEKKAQAECLHYELSVPPQDSLRLAKAVEQLLASPQYMISRDDKSEPIDARKDLADLSLRGDVLRFGLWATRNRSVRPREILEILGLGHLEQSGTYLTRSQVDLQTANSIATQEMETS